MHKSILTVAICGAALTGLATPSVVFAQAGAGAAATAQTASEKLVNEVVKAYKKTPAISDEIKIVFAGADGAEQKMTWTTALGRDDAMSFDLDGFTVTAMGGSLYVFNADVDDKYVKVPVEGTVLESLTKLMGQAPPIPHLALRYSDTQSDHLNAMVFGMLPNVKLGDDVTDVKTDDGRMLKRIALISEMGGNGTIDIDPKTNLIAAGKVTMQPQGAPEPMGTLSFTMKTMAGEKLTNAIAVNIDGRSAVDNLSGLQPTPLQVGQAAPDFTLASLNGDSVTLSELKGNVVVLDFWATWCGPCKRGLPYLQEFATWASSADQNVKVYAVNTWERTDSDEELMALVGDFWNSNGFTMPTLLDKDHAVVGAYKVSGIPTTVIIGPDGKVSAMHVGFDPNMVDTLKKDVETAQKGNEG